MAEKKIETRGRPRVDSTPVTVRLTPDMLAWLDAERAKQDPVPSRPEMVRIYLAERQGKLIVRDS